MHITQLEDRKRMATQNEDYDAAKVIKVEIDKVRQALYNPQIEEMIQMHLGGGSSANHAKTPQHNIRGSHQQFQTPNNGQQTPQQFSQSQQNFGKQAQEGMRNLNLQMKSMPMDEGSNDGMQPRGGKQSLLGNGGMMMDDSISPPSIQKQKNQ